MSIIASDGLSLLVGDGLATEGFTALVGGNIFRWEIAQRNQIGKAVSAPDAWQINVGTSDRRAMLEGEAFMSDAAPAQRLRSLALCGMTGNFKLKLNATETLSLTAIVASYREVITPGEIKKMQFRLESSGTVMAG